MRMDWGIRDALRFDLGAGVEVREDGGIAICGNDVAGQDRRRSGWRWSRVSRAQGGKAEGRTWLRCCREDCLIPLCRRRANRRRARQAAREQKKDTKSVGTLFRIGTVPIFYFPPWRGI